MREFILILLYILCSLLPALYYRYVRKNLSGNVFWVIWLLSLTGTFIGGIIGVLLPARFGFEIGYGLITLMALVFSWFVAAVFLKLWRLPEAW